MQSSVTTISWREAKRLGGGPFSMSLKPEMLLDGGLVVRRKYAKPGRKSHIEKPDQWYDVVYDREYVEAWFENHVLQQLNGIPYNQLQKLLSSAMTLHKERAKEFGDG